ncbi:MAG: 16S rRNA (uracil(1498)-N(3))-methyltransferase [Aphanocapsa lilacina HA4352-LM1]|jgi:16S rRNA (uracil1498-N3)-methyltransferase|nr:16S rRNA (uracil(1498)-N(3))-methyltransferase [Aphanocapsa lilacina HA4352-LM1]
MGSTTRLFLDPVQFSADTARLDPAQSHYLRQVLRLRDGASCIIGDGLGNTWQATLAGNTARLGPLLPRTGELPLPVTIACAVPKGDRWDSLLQKSTELGADRIVPLVCERSVVQPDAKRRVRWQAIVREAAEQSERAVLPVVEPPALFGGFLKHPARGTRLICTARGVRPPLLNFLPATALTLLFGPEGGFSEGEVAAATDAGYQVCSLGSRILRTETAPLLALGWIAAWYEGKPEDT